MDGVKVIGFFADGSSINELNSVFASLELSGCETTIAGLTSIVVPGDGSSFVTNMLIEDVNVSEYPFYISSLYRQSNKFSSSLPIV